MFKNKELNRLRAENLRLKNERIMMIDIINEYDKKNGNAYTYIRKIANILRYSR